MADPPALAGLLDRAGHVFHLAWQLGRKFQEERATGGGLRQIDPTSWTKNQPAFNDFCAAILDLRDAMQNPPKGFGPVAQALIKAAGLAKQIRDAMQTADGQTWAAFLDFFPEVNSVAMAGYKAIQEVTKARRLDDPFAFVDQPSITRAMPQCPGCGSAPAATDVDDECPNCGAFEFLCGIIEHVPLGDTPVIKQQVTKPRWKRIPPSQVGAKQPAGGLPIFRPDLGKATCFDALIGEVLYWRNGVLPFYWCGAYHPSDFQRRTADPLRRCLVWLDARGFNHLSARLQSNFDEVERWVAELDSKYDEHPAPADATESDSIVGDRLLPCYDKTSEFVELVEDIKKATAASESLIERLLAGPDDVELSPRDMALLEAHLWQPVSFATGKPGKTVTGHSATEAARNKLTLIRDFNRELREQDEARPEKQTDAVPAVTTDPAPKRSTARGEGRPKLIAALTEHHQYADGGCLNLAPIGNNELAKAAGVSPSTASAFFSDKFQGHTNYKALCRDASKLLAALKLLNDEFAPYHLLGDSSYNLAAPEEEDADGE
jgi:hypothetical protein